MAVLNTAVSYQSLKEELALASSNCSMKQRAKKQSQTDSTKLESPYCQESHKGRKKKKARSRPTEMILNKILANWIQEHRHLVGFIPRKPKVFNNNTKLVSVTQSISRLKDRNYVFIPVDAKEAFYEVQLSLRIKTLRIQKRKNMH